MVNTSRQRAVRRRAVTALLVGAVGAGLLLLPRAADAYCRTSSCPNKVIGTACVPARASDCGVPLFWPTPCVGFTIQKDAEKNIPSKTVDALTKQAFAAWTDADCGAGAHPLMRVDDLGLVTCDVPEYNPSLANSNTIMFRSNGWPYPSTNTIALTTVTFNLDTGEIRDADMELNSTDIAFSTSDTDVTYDLLSILTHETGHFLGLAHSTVAGATMIADYPPKSLTLRTLEADDVAGICAVYPPGAASDTCDSTPRNGLGDACKSPKVDPTTSGCCAVAPGAEADEGERPAVILGLFAALVWTARRARRRLGPSGRT